MSKYLGIHFKIDDDSGIAKVTIENITKSEYVVFEKEVDLYFGDADGSASPRESEDFIHWTSLPYPDDNYDVLIVHSGKDNLSTTGPTSAIQVSGFFTTESLNPAEIQNTLYAWHTDHPNAVLSLEVVKDTLTDFEQFQGFIANGSDTEFILSHPNHAHEFNKVSDAGAFIYPESTEIVWGSNGPDYDNEVIDDNGQFVVKFDVAPTADNIINIYYQPKINKVRMKTKLKQPTDGINFIDYRSNVKLLDHILELI